MDCIVLRPITMGCPRGDLLEPLQVFRQSPGQISPFTDNAIRCHGDDRLDRWCLRFQIYTAMGALITG